MKRAILLSILLMMVVAVSADAKKKPQIQFEETTINLGTFPQNDAVRTVTFRFKNVGNAKLVINYVHTSCGCTNAQFPKDYIEPGGYGEIVVTYDGRNKVPGKFTKGISVYTNESSKVTRLYIEGNMTMAQQTK